MSSTLKIYSAEWQEFINTRITYNGRACEGPEATLAREEFLINFAHLPTWVQAYAVCRV